MSRAGIAHIVAKLEVTGVVRPAGIGHGGFVEMAADHPLAPILLSLFKAEHKRYLDVLEGVREAARTVRPEPLALWQYGSVARSEDTEGSDFDLAVVVEVDREVEDVVDRTRDVLEPLGTRTGISFSVIGLSIGDVLRLSEGPDPFWSELSSQARALRGPEPDELLARHANSRRTERRSRGSATGTRT